MRTRLEIDGRIGVGVYEKNADDRHLVGFSPKKIKSHFKRGEKMDLIRQLFCKNDYEYIKDVRTYSTPFDEMPYKCKRIYICPKCLKKKTIRY